jgi:glycerophosphoryl diester phosphodiesterase
MILHQSEYNNEMSCHRYLSVPGIAISAHRGGSIEAPENTIEAFQYALDLGCKYIETDVQLSSDGIPYIFHDDDLKRLLNKEIQFNSLQSSEVDKLMLFQKYNIPTLEAVLLKFPEALFQIDVKTNEVTMPALEIIEKCNAMDRVCIASFDSSRLKKVSDLYPEVCISMGPKEVLKLLLSSFKLYNKEVPGNCLQIPIYQYGLKLVTQRFINHVQSKGLKIMVWTINDEETMRDLIKLGVNGIITDKPRVLKDVLAET